MPAPMESAPRAARSIAILISTRLRLRPFEPADAPAVHSLAGAAEVAEMMLHVPHPYPEGYAERWIAGQRAGVDRGLLTWAVTLREPPDRRQDTRREEGESAGGGSPDDGDRQGAVVGTVTLSITAAHQRADLGYWVGVPYWGRGYATEAARLVISYGFDRLHLHRIQARCFPRNGASARVLQKAGMRYEGTLRGYLRKGDAFEDALLFAIVTGGEPAQPPRAQGAP